MSTLNAAYANCPTVALALTTSTANTALPQKGPLLLVSNLGTNPAWVSTGSSAVTATASTGNGVCIPGGQTFLLRVSPLDEYIAGITATSTSTLSISCVNGGVRF